MSYQKFFLPDFFLTLPVLFLLSLGILVIYSSDPQLALYQFFLAVSGLVLYFLISLVDLSNEDFYIRILYFIGIALLAVVFIFGAETRGSIRWFSFGSFHLQPSEIIKPILILFLARFWSIRLPSWKNIAESLLWVLPVLGLVFKQPDLGTALIILSIWLTMLLGANVSLLKTAAIGLSSFILSPLAWLYLQDYQKKRLFSFMSPQQDPLGSGYNIIQSTIAVGSGQIFGRGLGRGTQSRLQFLPEFRTDFIFASIAEEFGFIGSFLVLTLYGVILGRMFYLLTIVKNRFGSLIIFGVLGMIFFQMVVNIGMNIGILPITGITLPLLSYGGSSLISTLISLGLVASVSRFYQNRKELQLF